MDVKADLCSDIMTQPVPLLPGNLDLNAQKCMCTPAIFVAESQQPVPFATCQGADPRAALHHVRVGRTPLPLPGQQTA